MEKKDKLFSDLFDKKDYAAASQFKAEELSDSPDLILRLAFSLFATQKSTEALSLLKEKQELCVKNHYFHALCGEILLQQKKPQIALRCFTNALKLNPPPSHKERISFFIKKIKELAEKSSRAAENNSETEKKTREIAALFADNQFEKVIKLARNFLESNPLCVSIMEKLALSCYQQKDFTSAWEIFEELTQIEPNQHLHYYHLGITSIEKKELTTAVISLKKSIQLNPIHQKSYYALAGIYGFNGLKNDEHKLLQEIMIINPFTDIAEKAESLLKANK